MTRVHVSESDCACDDCRTGRVNGAFQFAREVRDDIAKLACQCVKEFVKGDRQIRDAISYAEGRLWTLLLVWEITGNPDASALVGGRRQLLLDEWYEAAKRFENLSQHSCDLASPK